MIIYNHTLYNHTLGGLKSTCNFFILCTNVKVYLYSYSEWLELRKKGLNANAGVSNGASLLFGLSSYLHPYFVYARNEGFWETAHIRRLA